ncbi:MAG: DNA-binding protein [Planctomycetes bacterium]|nr:DNA-binding protein [Planctomycetota bacterium]
MKLKRIDTTWVIVLQRGEKIIESLTAFVKAKGIKSGHFNAIGAISRAEVAHYSVEHKKYTFKEFEGALEILGILGSASCLPTGQAGKDNDIVMHAHITLSDEKTHVYGGHLKEAVVSATCEIMFTELSQKILRKHNPEIGLNLMDLE